MMTSERMALINRETTTDIKKHKKIFISTNLRQSQNFKFSVFEMC